jgi:tetrapyrrole methylase family protein/MazG family protein
LEAWHALTSRRAFCAPGDELGARLRNLGYEVGELAEAAALRVEAAAAAEVAEVAAAARPGGAPAAGLAGKNLLAPQPHAHAADTEGARALAAVLAGLAAEHGEIAFAGASDAVVRAVFARALEGGLDVEVVIGASPPGHTLLELVRTMARLRAPGGCPWDAEQTHQTLAKHLLDETYELLDAIETGTDKDIAEELGDLLLQVVFHAQMGADARTFDIDDVSTTLVEKLVRRHPHVFGDVEVSGAREVVANWDRIKHQEKKRASAVEDIPASLPALAYAQKLQRRAGSAGFDWSDASGALAKVREEAEELAAAARDGDEDAREDELGDLLFSVVALGRHLGIDAETALRRSARKFKQRFEGVERAAVARGVALSDLPDDELERMWGEQT